MGIALLHRAIDHLMKKWSIPTFAKLSILGKVLTYKNFPNVEFNFMMDAIQN